MPSSPPLIKSVADRIVECSQSCIGDDDDVSHDGIDGEAFWLSGLDEVFEDIGKAVVAAYGRKRCREESRPDVAASSSDGSVAVACSAVAWMGSAGRQACSLAPVDLSEFGHAGDQHRRQDGTYTGNGAQDGLTRLQLPAACDDGLDLRPWCRRTG